jgi:hypothetical protein
MPADMHSGESAPLDDRFIAGEPVIGPPRYITRFKQIAIRAFDTERMQPTMLNLPPRLEDAIAIGKPLKAKVADAGICGRVAQLVRAQP